jgi:hypothetical protein
MPLYTCLHNLLNVLVQTANKMGLQSNVLAGGNNIWGASEGERGRADRTDEQKIKQNTVPKQGRCSELHSVSSYLPMELTDNLLARCEVD